MSQAPTKPAPPAETDLDYAIEDDVPGGPINRDSQFVFARVPKVVAEITAAGARGPVLDVACGFGTQMEPIRQHGLETWGLEASFALSGYCRLRFAGDGGAPMVCAVAEHLPFRDGTFDRIVSQGSIDHFPEPEAFMREAARVLKPDGRAVIAISNYDSLSCRLGRLLHGLRRRLRRPVFEGRNYWEIPPNHTFRGTYAVLRRLGEPHLELVACRGISLLWLFRRWTRLMEALPGPVAWATMSVLDRMAFRAPAIADIVVSVWRPRSGRIGG